MSLHDRSRRSCGTWPLPWSAQGAGLEGCPARATSSLLRQSAGPGSFRGDPPLPWQLLVFPDLGRHAGRSHRRPLLQAVRKPVRLRRQGDQRENHCYRSNPPGSSQSLQRHCVSLSHALLQEELILTTDLPYLL